MKIECANCGFIFTYEDDGNRSFGLTSDSDYHIDKVECPKCETPAVVRINLDYSKVDFSDFNKIAHGMK